MRAREDAHSDLMCARHRLSKLLLRQVFVWEGKTWTAAHERWLAQQRFAERPLQIAYEEALATMHSVAARRAALVAAIAVEATEPRWAEVVGRLACLRGVSTLTAFGLAVEVGDWQRFRDAHDPAAGVAPGLWQKVVGCAINHGAERVEVGVHRGLRADGDLGTVGFGLSALLSLGTVDLVESII